MTRKSPPIAICLECGMPYYTLDAIIRGCAARGVAGPCDGEVAARWGNDDWILCPSCNGNGCQRCHDTGWFPAPRSRGKFSEPV